MNRNTNRSNSTTLILHRRAAMQVALPFQTAMTRPILDDATRAEVVAALARMLLEAVGVGSDAEASDDA